MQYTSSQQPAIETIDRNLQIIARAGFGKIQFVSRTYYRITLCWRRIGGSYRLCVRYISHQSTRTRQENSLPTTVPSRDLVATFFGSRIWIINCIFPLHWRLT